MHIIYIEQVNNEEVNKGKKLCSERSSFNQGYHNGGKRYVWVQVTR